MTVSKAIKWPVISMWVALSVLSTGIYTGVGKNRFKNGPTVSFVVLLESGNSVCSKHGLDSAG